jgi:hypothetical protein
VKKATIVISLILHAGIAFGLVVSSQRRASGKTFFVQMQEEAKKKKAAEPKPKPVPKVAKVDPRPKETKVVAAPKAMPVEAPVQAKAVAAIMPTDIAMSNEDIGDAVAIPVIVRQPQAAAPTKVASFEPDAHRRRALHGRAIQTGAGVQDRDRVHGFRPRRGH